MRGLHIRPVSSLYDGWASRFTFHASRITLWFEADALPEIGRVKHSPGGDHPLEVTDVADRLQRVAVDENQVGALAGFDRADFFIELHHAGRDDGRRLNRFHGREAGFHVKLNLAVQA